jgi:hypothetical protein
MAIAGVTAEYIAEELGIPLCDVLELIYREPTFAPLAVDRVPLHSRRQMAHIVQFVQTLQHGESEDGESDE